MPDCQFVWAGGFSFGKISEGYEEIRALMKNLPSNVKFLGLVDREKMNEVYNMADVMFLPSYEELFPMTILESMNCALPVLVRDLPEYRPILFDHALTGRNTEEFVRTHASYEGHERYSRTAVGNQWKAFYEKVFRESAEGKKLKNKRNLLGKERKEELVWKNRKQQYI